VRARTFAVIAALVAALLSLGFAALYAYDTSRDDLIAEGVTVDGVAVGGMRVSEARTVLQRALLDPLRRPVVVRHQQRRFTLTAERAGVGVDVDGSVDRALAASRGGNLLSRAWRDLTGGQVERDLPVDATYDRAAVTRLVKRVQRTLDRPAVDASVDLEHGDVTPRQSSTGVQVRARLLRREITTSLLSRVDSARDVRVRTRVVQPKVPTEELAEQYPAVIVVDRAAFKLTLYKNLERVKTYGIAVGQVGLETPAGLYHIQNKAENPAWHVPDSDWAGKLRGKVIPPDDPDNPIKARWMGIYDGAGIHGTTAESSIGSAASHGCIRMRIPEVIELYEQVPLNAPVYIS
jgi:lipoprotein-anchoring transpeptidase ErfK/SrfK